MQEFLWNMSNNQWKNKDLIVGLDIGTSKVVCLVGKYDSSDNLEILSLGTYPSSGLKKGVRTFVLYDTGSLTETAWFWKCAKTQMTIHFTKDSWSVRQMPKAGVIVDVITMKICVLPCIIRIQSRPSGRNPICNINILWEWSQKLEHCWNQCSNEILVSFFSPPNEEGPPQMYRGNCHAGLIN